jgi:hypothetical protein
MVLEEQEKSTSTQLDLFAENLPNKPYCTDDKSWLQIRKKATAIKKKYIQHNQPQMVHWLVYDCDYAGALEHVGDNQLPAPNLIATNPENGNSHLFYRLADAVCKSDLARRKPLSLLAKIDFVLTEKLEADKGYQGFISKNLLHPHWIVQEVHQQPWNLGDFLEWIDIPTRLPKRAQTQGLGRNCTMFEKARFWAYSKVLSYRLTSTRSKFYEAVLGYCETINQGFPSPLNHSEVRSTAKSVALWTWRNYTGASRSDEDWAKYVAETHTPEIQRERQALQAESRREKTQKTREQAKAMRAEGSTIRAIAEALSVSVGTISNWLKAN